MGLIVTIRNYGSLNLDDICNSTDIIQIGSRNMQNYPLLTECAKTQMSLIMLKRHYGSSLRDWLVQQSIFWQKETKNVILCERGVSVPHTHRSIKIPNGFAGNTSSKRNSHLPII